MFSIKYTEKAVKSLGKIPKKWQSKLARAVENLRNNPYQGKKLQGTLFGVYSFRVWPYRIIYTVEKKKILILEIS